jgi:aspartate racemase
MSALSERLGPSPGGLLQDMTQAAQNGTTGRDAAIPKREWSGPAPLSFAQERLWYLDRLSPGTSVYSMPAAFDVEGPLDVGMFGRAVAALVERHAILRTKYGIHGGEPAQSVDPAATAEFRLLDAGGCDEDEIDRMLRREAARPFDLARGTALRVVVVQREPRRHVLFFNQPHIAGDAWSYTVLFLELGHLYGAMAARRDDPLPTRPLDYRDFAAWQREWFRGEVLERKLDFWKRHLAGAQDVELPLDRPRPRFLSGQGESQQLDIPEALASSVARLSRERCCTPFMGWLAGCFLLLRQWTGAEDLVVATPSANRSSLELEPAVGLFANTLLLRAAVPGGSGFAGLLERVRQVTLDAFAHDDIPLEKIVAALEPERQPNREPYLRTMFTYGTAGGALAMRGTAVTPRAIECDTAKFDLHLHIQDGPDTRRIFAQYRKDLFDGATIARLLRDYVSLMERATDNPEISLNPGVSGSGCPRQEAPSAPPRRQYPEAALPELFAVQVRERPNAIAVTDGDALASYGELNRRANAVAAALAAAGAKSGSCVGLLLPRSIDAIAAMLGILKCGAAYVPLDPAHPQERLDLLAEDCGIQWIVTRRGYEEQIPAGAAAVRMDELPEGGDGDTGIAVSPDDLACVLYTSGSTGKPNGVEVLHRGIVRLLFGVDYARFGPGETLLHAAPLSFDAASFEIWGALLHGGRCAIFPEDLPSPRKLASAVREHGITTAWLTSALFNLAIDEAPEALAPLRQLLIGGEALSVPHVRAALQRLPDTVLVNGYGPTEATTFTCCYQIPRELPGGAASVPIGRPIGGIEVYVLDPRGEPVPPGSAGELWIGGDGVARGYRNRPELTRERFFPNRFSGRGKLYRSGDLVRLLPDGNLEFLGRLDEQVKIRGFRIEPGEIEAALLGITGIRGAAVVAPRAGAERTLAAYVEISTNWILLSSQIREYLEARLPAYMVPSRIELVDRLPLKANGKVDRAALAALGPGQLPGTPPADETERRVAEIWEKLLLRDCLDVEADFFQMGGDSLLLVRVASALEGAFGREIPLSALIQASTIRGMAKLTGTADPAEWKGAVAPIQPHGSKPPLFGVRDVRGEVLLFGALSKHLGADQPVYGLLPCRIEPGNGVFPTIEEIAARYVREIRAVQGAGPYRLAGACFGGVIAFEMARQLEAAGERVELLALIEAFAAHGAVAVPMWPRAVGKFRHWCERLIFQARTLAEVDTAALPEYLVSRGHTLQRRILKTAWLWRRRVQSLLPGAGMLDADLSEHAGYCAIQSYTPKPYAGDAVLFRARDRSALDHDIKAGWGGVIRGTIEICEVPGDHMTMLSHPNRSVLAEELARRLERTGRKSGRVHP